ncbi:MAG: helix-turn-helix domain-containing protein [Holophagales bacterium]|nr:helix-turn-helix domain-containing protein [Holophagales bacterium]MYF96771.1 helix-turn-helix domain-containing protein [Holophagales bacterium]
MTRKEDCGWLHGVARELIEAQAASIGLPLRFIQVDPDHDPPSYDEVVGQVCSEVRESGSDFIAFSDLFSSRRRERRTQLVSAIGLTAVFPLWGRDSGEHSREILESEMRARICAVVPTELPRQRAGLPYDANFIGDLPAHVDPCGEHDEFHTFVENAPGWRHSVTVEAGEVVDRYGLACRDLFLATSTPSGRRLEDPTDRKDFEPFTYYRRLRRVHRHIQEHFDETLTIESVAHVAALAPSSFRRYFRKRVGTSFGSWLASFRMEQASKLLRASNTDVAEVAAMVGYPLGRSFRRAFKRHTGHSPSAFRALYLLRSAGEPAPLQTRAKPGRRRTREEETSDPEEQSRVNGNRECPVCGDQQCPTCGNCLTPHEVGGQ